MKRFAAHIVFYQASLPLHYVEIGDDGCLNGVFALTEEIAGTAFYDGILFPLPVSVEKEVVDQLLRELEAAGKPVSWEIFKPLSPLNLEHQPVRLLLLDRHRYTSAELRAYD